MPNDMGIESAALILAIATLTIMFYGDPDIADAIIFSMNEVCQK